MTEDESYRLNEIERATADIRGTLNALESQHQRWEDNQKWQINDLREQVREIGKSTNWFLSLIIFLLAYIAYKLS